MDILLHIAELNNRGALCIKNGSAAALAEADFCLKGALDRSRCYLAGRAMSNAGASEAKKSTTLHPASGSYSTDWTQAISDFLALVHPHPAVFDICEDLFYSEPIFIHPNTILHLSASDATEMAAADEKEREQSHLCAIVLFNCALLLYQQSIPFHGRNSGNSSIRCEKEFRFLAKSKAIYEKVLEILVVNNTTRRSIETPNQEVPPGAALFDSLRDILIMASLNNLIQIVTGFSSSIESVTTGALGQESFSIPNVHGAVYAPIDDERILSCIRCLLERSSVLNTSRYGDRELAARVDCQAQIFLRNALFRSLLVSNGAAAPAA